MVGASERLPQRQRVEIKRQGSLRIAPALLDQTHVVEYRGGFQLVAQILPTLQ